MVMGQVEVLSAACCVAAADQTITDDESAYLQKLAGRIGVGAASLEAMIDRATHEDRFVREQFRLLKAEPEQAMRTLFRVAIMDGRLQAEEQIMLEHFAQVLGVDQARFQQYLKAARKATG